MLEYLMSDGEARMGRPPVGPRIEFRVPVDVRDFLRDYAAEEGFTVAELHREILVRAAQRLAHKRGTVLAEV